MGFRFIGCRFRSDRAQGLGFIEFALRLGGLGLRFYATWGAWLRA